MAYIIKRYSNRKLYDPQASRYVTLDDLKQLVHDGRELRVEDATSGEDLTPLMLTQILLESERAHQATLPSALLHQLIKQGEAWYEFLQRTMSASSIDPNQADVERLWNEWAARVGWHVPPAGQPEAAPDTGADSAASRLEREVAALREQLAMLEQRVKPARRTPQVRAARRPARRRR